MKSNRMPLNWHWPNRKWNFSFLFTTQLEFATSMRAYNGLRNKYGAVLMLFPHYKNLSILFINWLRLIFICAHQTNAPVPQADILCAMRRVFVGLFRRIESIVGNGISLVCDFFDLPAHFVAPKYPSVSVCVHVTTWKWMPLLELEIIHAPPAWQSHYTLYSIYGFRICRQSLL